MKRLGLPGLALLSLSACATAPGPQVALPGSADELILETRRAAVYLTQLRDKKNRFWESQGIEESYEPDGAATSRESQILAAGYREASDCDRIAHSSWGSSVLYGQSFLGYENYVNTVSRCYTR